MKFGHLLKMQLTPEWRTKYISYDKLKDILDNFTLNEKYDHNVEQHLVETQKTKFKEHFLNKVIIEEIEKCNTFYQDQHDHDLELYKDINEKWQALKMYQNRKRAKKHEEHHHRHHDLHHTFNQMKTSEFWHHTFNHMKLGHKSKKEKFEMLLLEFYYRLYSLKCYQTLNCEGFRKILKKFDKNVYEDQDKKFGKKFFKENIENKAIFYTDRSTEKLMNKIEMIMIEIENGDKKKAMNKLRVPEMDREKYDPYLTGIVGVLLGILITILILFIYQFQVSSDEIVDRASNLFRLYRPAIYLSFFSLLIAADISAFRKTGVNYILIFEMDPRLHMTSEHIWLFALFSNIFVLLFFYIDMFLVISDGLLPVIMYSSLLLYIFNPLPILQFEARFWIVGRIARSFSFGLLEVRFTDFWLADQFNSLASFFTDIASVVCLLGRFGTKVVDDYSEIEITNLSKNNDIGNCKENAFIFLLTLGMVPPFMRFAQCFRRYLDTDHFWPHMWNAGKYLTGMIKVVCSALFIKYSDQTWSLVLYILSHILASTATILWDYLKDWGFFNSSKNRWLCLSLRDELILDHHYYYYFAIIENLIIRWIWILAIILKYNKLIAEKDVVWTTLIFALLELLRRGIWNFIRLEHEHLHNCGDFRVMRRISFKKKDSEDDYELLAKIMDRVDDDEIRKMNRKQV